MGFIGVIKAIGVAAMAVAIFYVGGMASLEALSYLREFDWAIKTATFWTGGVLLTLVLAVSTRLVIASIAAFIDDEGGRPQAKPDAEDKDEPLLPSRPTARPVPPKPPVAAPPKKP